MFGTGCVSTIFFIVCQFETKSALSLGMVMYLSIECSDIWGGNLI